MKQRRIFSLLSKCGLVVLMIAGLVQAAFAQADYPFRDPKLGDDQRIADLLGRLTLEEKIQLMSRPSENSRLGLVFSGQVEGLHGLALGGPGGWGAERPAAAADDDVSAGKRTGRDLGPGAAEEDCIAGGLRGALRLSESPSMIAAASWCARPMPT